MNDCAAAIDTVRKQIGTAREKVNPIERIFRAKWELKARMRSGKPLHSIGTILFNATFGARVDQASYTRMVRRDRQTFKVPSRERDRTAKPNKSR
ncbi:MAG TPA: hypothetical protein VLV78_23015 [Thermoanaerobaculia bacterium]|nr:hypothetical protein [Thermoanaerobaculia bacterium]